MNRISILILLLPLLVKAQEKNIDFKQNHTWKQIQEMAILENKNIFVDCYATWCIPCKQMDHYIYTNPKVAEYFNEKFISVKVQIDTTMQDNSEVKSWYSDAHLIQKLYKISAFPTFLFFSPNGVIVHRSVGFKSEREIIALGNDALNPKKQYYSMLESYRQGKKDYSVMPYLINTASDLREMEIAQTIGNDYARNYLPALNDSNLYTQENLRFLNFYTQNSMEKGFRIFYENSEKINKIMGNGSFAQHFVDNIISKEEVAPILSIASQEREEPDWGKIENLIKIKYTSVYAGRIIMDAKVQWYKSEKNLKMYTRSLIDRVSKYGPVGLGIYDFDLNRNAWQIFLFSHSRKELLKALEWSNNAVSSNNDSNKANWMDTNANILYKLGRIREAICVEEEVVSMEPNSRVFIENLHKMKINEPTWPLK